MKLVIPSSEDDLVATGVNPGSGALLAPGSAGVTVAPFETPLNLFWILLGVALCVYSGRLGVFGPSGPDSGFFPMLAGAMIALAGALLLLQKGSRVAKDTTFWSERGGAARVCSLVFGMFVLVLLTRYLGFLAASVLMMPILMRLIEKRSMWYAVVVGLCTTAAVQMVFIYLLGMRMPRGPFGF